MEQIKFLLDDLIDLLDSVVRIDIKDQNEINRLMVQPKFDLLYQQLQDFGYLERYSVRLSKSELRIPKLSEKGKILRVRLDDRKVRQEFISIFPDGFSIPEFNSAYEKLLESVENNPIQQTAGEAIEEEVNSTSSTLSKSTSAILTERDAQIRIALRRPNLNFWWLNAHPDYWRMSRMRVGNTETYSFYNEKGNRRNQQKSFEAVKPGDLMVGYETREAMAVQALFEIVQGKHGEPGNEFISFRLLQFLPKHPRLTELRNLPEFSKMTIAKQQVGSLYDLSEGAFKEILEAAGISNAALNEGQRIHKNFVFRDLNSIEPAIGAPELATEVSDLIKSLHKEPGMMVGIFGRWGRGKTFLFNLVWEKLCPPDKKGKKNEKLNSVKNRFVRADFHAWKYQDTEASWAYLYEVLAGEFYNEVNGWWKRKSRLIRLNWARGNNWEIILFLITLFLAVLFIVKKDEYEGNTFVAWVSLGLGLAVSSISGYQKFYDQNATKAKELLKKYTTKHSYKNLMGIQAEIQSEIKTLFQVWFNGRPERKVILFVDDIDRCDEERIIEIVDALRVMLEDDNIFEHLIIVAAIDERILRRAIRLKYKGLIDEESDIKERKLNDLTEEYMDKLFIAGIRLGELMPAEKSEIFAALTKGQVENLNTEANPVATANVQTAVDRGASVNELSKTDTSNNLILDFDPKVHTLEEQTFEINSLEAEAINKGIALLNHSTPRQIRIFYYRYVLARNFLRALKGLGDWGKEAIQNRSLVQVIVYLTNADLMGEDVLDIIRELSNDESVDDDVKEYLNSLDEAQRTEFFKVLEMVVAY